MAAAALAHRQSDYASAMTLADQGITLYRALDDRAGPGRALQTCAWIACDMHDRVGAERMFRESLAILREAGDQRSAATIPTELARIVHQPGINDEQRADHAARVGMDGGYRACAVRARLAGDAAGPGRGGAFRLFDTLPAFPAPGDRAEYEQFVCQARAALGDAFGAAWAEGAASVDKAA